ncbi:hypothetical protein G9A89_008330 [Geosiphon pyriformis]|nr:hypothetical protein G9A89_008330 [Geosiphon pyriformis]
MRTPPRREYQYHRIIGEWYERNANRKGWLNKNGSIFPISVQSLCDYIQLKSARCEISTILSYVNALGKYQADMYHVYSNWDNIRYHPEVQNTLTRCAREKRHLQKQQDESHCRPKNVSNLAESSTSASEQASGIPGENFKMPLLDCNMKGIEINDQISHHERRAKNNYADIFELNGRESERRGKGDALLKRNPNLNKNQKNPFAYSPENEVSLYQSRMLIKPPFSKGNTDAIDENSIPTLTTNPSIPVVNLIEDNNPVHPKSLIPIKIEVLPSATPLLMKYANGNEFELLRFDVLTLTYLTVLKSKYTGNCPHHPAGCYPLDQDRHMILTPRMFKDWAMLMAADDADNRVTRESLPQFQEMPEFWVDHAVYIQE